MRRPVIYPESSPPCPITGIAEQHVICPVCGERHDFRNGNTCRCGWEAHPEIGLQSCDRCEEYQPHIEYREEADSVMCPSCYESWQTERYEMAEAARDQHWDWKIAESRDKKRAAS